MTHRELTAEEMLGLQVEAQEWAEMDYQEWLWTLVVAPDHWEIVNTSEVVSPEQG